MSVEHIYICDGCREKRSSEDGDIGVNWMIIRVTDLDKCIIEQYEVCSTSCAARVCMRMAKGWKGDLDAHRP